MFVLIRVLSYIIDFIIIILPLQLISIGVLGLPMSQANVLFIFLFAIYATLFAEYMNGMTLGKFFGKIKIVDRSGCKASIIQLSMRELTKAAYLTPVIGWMFGLISFVLIIIKKRSIHDMVGDTKVVYLWEGVDDGNEL